MLTEQNIKLCDHCKTKHPANNFIQREGFYLLVCADCSKELNKIRGNHHTEYESAKMGIYEAEFPED